ncbi:MAG TPA: ATP-binding protein, partial [Thermoanaerobaculia bacterium]|nr:ATP-binding protein [Thermoanaerobaculia bacterium]
RTTGEAFWASDRLFILERFGYGEETFFDVSYDPVRDETGAVGGVFCIVSETTGRVLSERRLKTLRELAMRTTEEARSVEEACQNAAQIFSANPVDLPFTLIYLYDPDAGLARLAGSAGPAEGSPAAPSVIDLSAPLDAAGAAWPLRAVLETGAAELVTDVERRFGRVPGGAWPEPPHSALVLPIIKSGQARLAGFLVAGINPRRALDDQYRAFLDLLANQIATAIASARAHEEERRRVQALAELDRAKTAFFSNVSHEFRTPLTLMLGPVEELLAKSHTDLSPAAASHLEVVNRNGLRLLRLVNTLLDFSRIEAGRVRASFQPTDLAAFTAELASVFRAAIERAGLRLRVNCQRLPEPVFVDRDMWEKVVLNLLSNAFKFTLEGEIEVTLRQTEGALVELRVRDTGTGIPVAEMPRLFERFHRVEQAQGRTNEGSGIGLALVQELVKLHGGTVAAESRVGEGTTFIVTLRMGSAHLPADQIAEGRALISTATGAAPFVEEALRWLPDENGDAALDASELPTDYDTLPVPAPVAPTEVDDDRPHVLVADDNADMRRYLVRLLAEHYQVKAVPDGEAALASVRQEPPDLLLTDVMMPRLDGFGLLREVRADPTTRELPVILLSARAGEEARVEGLHAGADDYLIKPFSARELVARVQSSLTLSRVRREAEQVLRQQSAQFKTLLDQAPLGVYVVDADFRIREINPVAVPVFGDVPGGVVGRDFDEVMHLIWEENYADEVVRVFRHTLETGEPFFTPERAEFRIDRGVTEYYEWRLDRIPLPDGRNGVVCYFRDISAQVNARKAIEESREALKEADRRKDEFLATLSHELRGPLAPLSNMLEIMKRPDAGAELHQQARTSMERQLSSLVRLVDDLLDVSRITRNNLELRKQRVELASIIHHALETCRPMAVDFEHELVVDLPAEPIYLDADPVRLAQVFSNLCHNACKYSERRGRVEVRAVRDGGEVVLSVKDRGLGIPPDQLDSIFEMFTQVDRTLERSRGGLGIGLTLVKRLVEMHGGTVKAHSGGRGRGSEFVVRLPILEEPARASAAERATASQAAQGHRILVVDDNPDSAVSLAELLRISGNETHVATDGLQAVEAAERLRPEAILLDIGLPGLNGYDACRRIRAQPWGKRMAMVALTGWGQEEDRNRSREAGFDGHLVKPVDYHALTELLASLLPRRSIATVESSSSIVPTAL